MPHEFTASMIAPLPDDPKEMATAVSSVAGAWADFLAAITTNDPSLQVQSSFSITETRAKPGPKPGTPQRRTRAAAGPGGAPELVLGDGEPGL